MNKKICVVLAAGDIPLGSIVTKVSGNKEYTLTDDIKFNVYNYVTKDSSGSKVEVTYPKISLGDDNLIMADSAGTFNIISKSVKLMWEVSTHNLLEYLELEICKCESK